MEAVSNKLLAYQMRPACGQAELQTRKLYEIVGRHVMDEVNGRLAKIPPPEGFPIFAERWCHFVLGNVEAARTHEALEGRRRYELGRREALEARALVEGNAKCSMKIDDVARTILPPRSEFQIQGSPQPLTAPRARAADPSMHGTAQVAQRCSGTALINDATPIRKPQDLAAHNQPVSRNPLEPASAITVTTGQDGQKLASQWLLDFLEYHYKKTRKATAERDVAPYVRFMIDVLGDRPMTSYSPQDLEDLNIAFCEIPHHGSVPSKHRCSLYERYTYAKKHGWDGLQKPSETTIVDRYGTAFNRFYSWLNNKRGFCLKTHKFEIFGDLTLALPRDAFDADEAKVIFLMPLFMGHDENDRWASGTYLTQSGIYWSWIFLILMGLRPSESAQIDPSDFVWFDRILYLDFRPFDPANGRVLRSQAKQQKSSNANRLIIVPPTCVDLGLISLIENRHSAGETRLLVDIKPKLLSGVDKDFGAAMARDWQKRKLLVEIARDNVSAYSGRHMHKELLKKLGIEEEDRERMMGHAVSCVSRGYGAKEAYDDDIAKKILEAQTPFLRWLHETLVDAYARAIAAGTLVQD